jgi:hypothetical protein
MLLANSWTDPLNPAFGSSREPPVRQITDNLTIVRGRHTFKGGLSSPLFPSLNLNLTEIF